MKSDTLLILGGSHCQMNAFRMARRRGYRTVLFDYLSAPPAASLADRHIQVSTFDAEACLAEAQKLELSGVMTLGTDQPVYTAAYIAKRMGLPCLLDVNTAFTATNKACMKRIFTQAGIPTAQYRLTDTAMLAQVDLKGPIVLKPTDSQGQKGVLLVKNLREAAALAPRTLSYSRQRLLLCETYYPSEEITVSAWVAAGRAHLLTVTDRRTFPHRRHIGVCAAHCFPSRAAREHTREVERLTQAVTDAFAIPAGPLYIQMLIGARGVLVNEMACRIGGAFEDVFIPKASGFDILSAVMEAALGREPPPPASPVSHGCARELMLFAREGTIAALTPPETLLSLPFVLDAGYYFTLGDRIPPFEHAGARLGYAVLWAENETDMSRYLAQFYDVFQVEDSTGRPMLLRRED
ncbi:MAG: ATP-grasp domain-containing protein [Clostridia bacterium]|nr:ATP-grasp domain-containing protein [Clostridia bacterium]